ncbi:MAG TPA: sigma-70 family RNA polymerase sigma factor [Bacteroidota bacterium]|nr:sigma-70 family RNA polymerase sigma factor [Bacteroidota bacterium]
MQQSVSTQRQQFDREDADLLKRIQRTDQRALSALYDRYAPVLFPFGLRMTGSHEATEDLLQEVFLHAWEHAGSYGAHHGSVYAWLTGVTRAKAMERMRSSAQKRKEGDGDAPRSRSASDGEQSTAQPETIITLKGITEEVRNSLKSLSKLELRLLELSYYEGQSQSDLARMLRIPLGTIKAKMRRGIQKLRQVAAPEEK